MTYKKDWAEFYDITRAKPPRPLLVEALKYVTDKGAAIDIGGGALRDTRYLLAQGFEVTVIDKSPLLATEAKNIEGDPPLHAQVTSYEDFAFPADEYVLASAMYALPFCEPKHFDLVMARIKASLKTGGIFCGQLFGDHDEWADNPTMTFHTVDQARQALGGLEIVSFKEVENDDTTAKGEAKHWHVFHFIARKI